MKALADKMETINLSLIVESLELYHIFAKGEIGFFEAVHRNRSLVDYPDAEYELAEVCVIHVGENTIKDARAKAVNVEK